MPSCVHTVTTRCGGEESEDAAGHWQALNTRDPGILVVVLKVMQQLVVSGEMIGEALVPYYRQLLPVLNLFKGKNVNIGDKILYNQRRRMILGDLIQVRPPHHDPDVNSAVAHRHRRTVHT